METGKITEGYGGKQMPRRANTQTQQEAVQENAAVQADAGADMQMEAAITKHSRKRASLPLPM